MNFTVDKSDLVARMRAPNSDVERRRKRQGKRVKLVCIKSLSTVDKGVAIYRIRVPLIEANVL